jgi:hypothetical protein
VAITTLAGVSFGLSGCSEQRPPSPNEPNLASMQNRGNGIYEFPATENFGQDLSNFRQANPDLTIKFIVPGHIKTSNQNSASVGYHDRYIVVTER